MPLLEDLAGKRVLILGLAREGKDLYVFLRRRFPRKQFGLADKREWNSLDLEFQDILEKDNQCQIYLGENYLQCLTEFDVILKSPGIPPLIPEIADAKQRGVIFGSSMQLFFELCPGTIIGVTGTKGKSTTSSLIYDVLRAGLADVRLVGNIGIPALAQLENSDRQTVFVIELSSHQLTNVNKSPHVAVLLNIIPEHLDYYSSFQAYVEAKQTITQYQTESDYLVFNAKYPLLNKIASQSKAQKIPVGVRGPMSCMVEDNHIVFVSSNRREHIIAVDDVPLRGLFNLENVMPSIAVGKIFNMPGSTISSAVKNFKPLEHRLEYVTTVEGISFYNDSLATVPEAVMAATDSFRDQGVILLLGGYDRGLDFQPLAEFVLGRDVRGFVFFRPSGERIWSDIAKFAADEKTLPSHSFVSTMRDAVQAAYTLAKAKHASIVLLSPASASFGTFMDYADRGDQFKQEVYRLAFA